MQRRKEDIVNPPLSAPMSHLPSACVTLSLHSQLLLTLLVIGTHFEPAVKDSYSDCISTNVIHTFAILIHFNPLQHNK